ncbi:band 7 protein [Pirellula staleyi DSM 6068]|uniref:Band 7 protein n=1 Tax=Pirellula staleyi (strain ATCC 27377 / DSM 6068 / ICPB 4128) TaxID=530564 RepID=D2R5X8_PIRSD|nr:SPFH domain-containing protein [Pirellula staleyi]ADB19063.1 band 7 protein [Pirellula staleyi DSM 6068]
MFNRNRLIVGGVFAAIALFIVGGMVHMTLNCIYVREGQSLMLRYKGPLIFGSAKPAAPGQFAEPGKEVGVLEQLRGPGRHFYCPIWWERTLVDDVMVFPGEVAIVTSLMGEQPPPGQFVVDGELSGPNRATQQGILRKVLGPGRYRINPFAFNHKKVNTELRESGGRNKLSGWVQIPAGYVGVVTNNVDNVLAKRGSGVQDKVLPPGIYPINPEEQQVDVVEVGFRETSIETDKIKLADGSYKVDESGEPEAMEDSGINFPSNDGFEIQLDFTAVWGVMPQDAPEVVRTFGSIQAVEQKVILPQAESICRNNGSKVGANALLVGESRQVFQEGVTADFDKVLTEKKLTLMYGLVRHIYIPKEVRIPLQRGYIADELTITREEERTTKTEEGILREAEKKVLQEAEKVRVETAKLVASTIAEGERKVGEIAAETEQQVAAIESKIAEFDAKKTELLGKAKATAAQQLAEAESQQFELAVKAFGSATAYSQWQFAENLPDNIQLQLLYAGEGTLWTDLKGIQPTLPLAAPQPAPKPKAVAPQQQPR